MRKRGASMTRAAALVLLIGFAVIFSRVFDNGYH